MESYDIAFRRNKILHILLYAERLIGDLPLFTPPPSPWTALHTQQCFSHLPLNYIDYYTCHNK